LYSIGHITVTVDKDSEETEVPENFGLYHVVDITNPFNCISELRTYTKRNFHKYQVANE
jgi:hypothetical protein